MSTTHTPGIGRHSMVTNLSLRHACAFIIIKEKAQTLRRFLRFASLSQSRPSIGLSFIHPSETVVWDHSCANFE